MRALRGGERKRERRLTPAVDVAEARGSGAETARSRAARGEEELVDGDPVPLVVVPGVVDVAGGGAVPSRVSLGLDDGRSDGGERIKSRPWRVVRKVQKLARNPRGIGGIWERRRMAAAQKRKRNPRAMARAPRGLLVEGKRRARGPPGGGGKELVSLLSA